MKTLGVRILVPLIFMTSLKHAVGLDMGIFSIIFLKDINFLKKLFKISKLFLEKRK